VKLKQKFVNNIPEKSLLDNVHLHASIINQKKQLSLTWKIRTASSLHHNKLGQTPYNFLLPTLLLLIQKVRLHLYFVWFYPNSNQLDVAHCQQFNFGVGH